MLRVYHQKGISPLGTVSTHSNSEESKSPTEDLLPEESQTSVDYIFKYKVQQCTCTEVTCISAHRNATCRRKPEMTPSGNWSYIPRLCKFASNCRNKDRCGLAHNDDEIRYHPEKYKTEMCHFPLNPKGLCLEYGKHCPYAHSKEELRCVVSNVSRPSVPSMPSRSRHKANLTVPPSPAHDPSDSVEIIQLRQELELLKVKAFCNKCRQHFKEWRLNCGHMVCSGCISGVMHQCPCCHAPLHKMHVVKLVDK